MMRGLFVTAMLGVLVMAGASAAFPATASAHVESSCDKSASFLGIPTWYKYLHVHEDSLGQSCSIETPKMVTDSSRTDVLMTVSAILLAVFEIILRIAVFVALVFIIWGGIQLQMSQGESERFSNARSTVINALIGLVITISATAIVNFVGNNLR